MSELKTPRFKVARRRYSQLKNTLLHDTAPDSTEKHPTQSTLSESEAFYRQMFERNRAVKLVVDPSTAQIFEANQAACDFYGYTLEQMKALRITDLTILSEAELLADMKQTITEKGTTFQARHRLASGDIRDVEIFSGLLEVNNKKYLSAIVQDITEQKRAEKALRESEALYRLFARNMPNTSVVMYDLDLHFTLAEGPYLKRFGAIWDDVVGKMPQDVYSEEQLKVLLPIYKRALQGEPFTFERVTVDYAYQAYVTPLRDASGKIIGGMILSHDITERIQAEKVARETEELQRLFTQYMPHTSVIMFNNEMRFTLAEGDFLNRTGLVSENLIGKTPQDVFSEETLNFMLPLYQRALHGEAFSYERVTPDYAYQSYANPLKNADGQIIGGMFLTYDITEAKQAEAALRSSETRFHSLVDLAPVGIIQTDLQGKRIFCNSHWCEMTGITLEQALGDEDFETIYPDDLPTATAAWETMMESKLPFDNVIFRYQRPDKTTVWVSGNGRPLLDTNEVVTGYLGTVTDISHHKLLEDTLVVSEARFRTLIDFAPVGIVETDANGSVLLANVQWSKLSGISEDNAITDKASSTIHPDDLARIQVIQQESVANGSAVDNIEYRFIHPDGKIIWVSDSSRPVFDELGNVNSHIITMTDITERKRLEDALRQNEERLRIITDNIQDLVSQSDDEGRFVFANPSYQTLLGYEPESLLGTSSLELIHPEDIERILQIFQTSLNSPSQQFAVETRLRHADGHYISVEIVGKLLANEQSNFSGGVFISRDISERKRLQDLLLEKEKLQGALDKELELSTLKTRMMERIAHEFRTPLTVIQASTETLTHYLDRLSQAQRAAKTDMIMRQIQRLTDMLEEIGLVINGSFMPDRIRRISTDVSAMCRELASELEVQFKRPGSYVLDLPETTRITLDPYVSKNAIMHVMRNAVRFSDPAAVVKVSLSYDEQGMTLRVIDSGIGIPSYELLRIFEPFFRGSNIGEISGMGVGLTIARAGIEAQGGTIAIKSVVGQGTTVTIWLPNISQIDIKSNGESN